MALSTNINTRNLPETQRSASNSSKVITQSPKRPLPQAQPSPKPVQQTKALRKTSKPIINWLQRKLGGSVKPKQAVVQPVSKVRSIGSSKGTGRVASSPFPSHVQNKQQGRLESIHDELAKRKTVSLNGDDDLSIVSQDNGSFDGSYAAQESLWSPASALEADEDASVRPLPPSSPPSPSPSRSSSSYLSDPLTFRSMAASTKPTTVLSVEINGNGMAHIAQAPISAGYSPITRLAAQRLASAVNPNVTFAALPPSPQSSRPSSVHSRPFQGSQGIAIPSVQAPLHTTHHPRNNPRPSSPPLDNASVLTLASSAFATPAFRSGNVTSWGSAPASVGVSDSASHFDGSMLYDIEGSSQIEEDERDLDASVRALRPRSSRRGSWESEASRWSARIQANPGTSISRDRSLWNSVRTGGFSLEDNGSAEKDLDTPDHEFSAFPSPCDVHLPPSPIDESIATYEDSGNSETTGASVSDTDVPTDEQIVERKSCEQNEEQPDTPVGPVAGE